MKGLLHRLAMRATGTAAALRSDLRLPFGGDGIHWPEPDESQVEGLVGEPARSALPGASASLHAPPHSTGFHEAEGDEAAAMRRMAKAPTPLVPREKTPQQADAMPPALGSETLVSAHSLPLGRARQAGAAAPGAEALSVTVPRRPLQKAAPTARHGSMPLDVDLPAPLMPEPHTAARARSTPLMSSMTARSLEAAARMRGAASARAEDPTEVHVHIGCIEVTAVQETPRLRRRPAAAAPAAMSLDSYLAARQRGRS
jgi:hypothetical protein